MIHPRYKKLLVLIGGIAIVNIVLLSPGLLGLQISGEHALETAFVTAVLAVSLFSLIYGSYVLLFKPPAALPLKEIRTHEDYVEALSRFIDNEEAAGDIHATLDQLERMTKKKSTLLDILGQRFNAGEISYNKFQSVILDVERLFYLNIRSILNKLHVFEASGLMDNHDKSKHIRLSDKLLKEKLKMREEFIHSVAGYISVNEEILLKLDKLSLEISSLDNLDLSRIENMQCIQEIDTLIKQTKLYKS